VKATREVSGANVIPASGALEVQRRRVDGSHYTVARSVVGVDLERSAASTPGVDR
jgi:hypothetical protein